MKMFLYCVAQGIAELVIASVFVVGLWMLCTYILSLIPGERLDFFFGG